MRIEIFEDFYALLGVAQSASPDEIRRAFRARMREWHPDVNHSADATSMTQRLIVAYKILNDAEARSHYDLEYSKRIRRASGASSGKRPEPKPRDSAPEPAQKQPEAARGTPEPSTGNTGYEDPDLNRWVHTARREAAEEWRRFAADFKDASKAAGAGAVHGLWMALIWGTVAFIIFSIIAAMH